MCKLVHCIKSRGAIRFVLAGLAAALLAGCSTSDPFSNPFQDSARFSGSDPTPTSSLQAAAPVSPVVSQPLAAPIATRPLAPVRPNFADGALSAPYHPSPAIENASGANQRFGAAPTSQIAERGGEARTKLGVWNAKGGTFIKVRPGDTARILATRYLVPLEVLLRVNGLSSAEQVRSGSRIVIPIYTADSALRRGNRRAPVRPLRRTARSQLLRHEKLRFVKGPSGIPLHRGTRGKVERWNKERRKALGRSAELRTRKVRNAAHAALLKKPPSAPGNEQAREPTPPRGTRLEQGAPRKVAIDSAATGSLPPHKQLASLSSDRESARPRFSWPVHGRIIEGFKVGSNDGINIAVPDGTTVKAADDGVVAYAGDELKGYGNLVLIRHPNGFVSAYADNGRLEVKRGESVKRGQAIAKSGQSGNVSSPQLHFELRKGQTPVDPTRYLAGL